MIYILRGDSTTMHQRHYLKLDQAYHIINLWTLLFCCYSQGSCSLLQSFSKNPQYDMLHSSYSEVLPSILNVYKIIKKLLKIGKFQNDAFPLLWTLLMLKSIFRSFWQDGQQFSMNYSSVMGHTITGYHNGKRVK